MNVASLELCKELYELSGWEYDYVQVTVNRGLSSEYMSVYELDGDEELDDVGADAYAYDLGYLLRKLPALYVAELPFLRCEKLLGGEWACGYWIDDDKQTWSSRYVADTPENATAKLAIELFKQGVLTREVV